MSLDVSLEETQPRNVDSPQLSLVATTPPAGLHRFLSFFFSLSPLNHFKISNFKNSTFKRKKNSTAAAAVIDYVFFFLRKQFVVLLTGRVVGTTGAVDFVDFSSDVVN